MNDGFLGMLRLAAVALQNAGFAVVVGALLARRWLARSASASPVDIDQPLAATLRAAALVSLAASMLAFWTHCALIGDTGLAHAWPAVKSMLVETSFGHGWLVGAAFSACVVVLSFVRASDGGAPLAMGAALAGVALARSHAGHPVDAGPFSLPVWADWLHLLAISAWVGLVVVAACIVIPRLVDAREHARAVGPSFVQSLSDTATAALVVLFATGAYNGWRGVKTPANLAETGYGQVLALKLALVLIAAALGGHNRFFEMPRLMSALSSRSAALAVASLRRFARVLQIESFVLALVLICAAVLVSSPLPSSL